MTKRFNLFFESCFFCLLLALLTVLATGKFAYAVEDGLKLWLAVIVPSLFPYAFLTTILSQNKATSKVFNTFTPITSKLFNTSGAVGYAYFLSIVSGYPVGAKTVSDLKNNKIISHTEAVRASALCSTSCPVFLIGSVGNIMFSSFKFGLILFFVHILSSIIIGVIFSFYKRKEKPSTIKTQSFALKSDNLFYDGVLDAVTSVLVVGGIITLFYIGTQMLLTFNLLSPLTALLSPIFGELANGVSLGLIECTGGLKVIANFNTASALPVCAFITGFGGLSVIIQSTTCLKKAKIKTAPFLLAKVLQAVISFILGVLAVKIFL